MSLLMRSAPRAVRALSSAGSAAAARQRRRATSVASLATRADARWRGLQHNVRPTAWSAAGAVGGQSGSVNPSSLAGQMRAFSTKAAPPAAAGTAANSAAAGGQSGSGWSLSGAAQSAFSWLYSATTASSGGAAASTAAAPAAAAPAATPAPAWGAHLSNGSGPPAVPNKLAVDEEAGGASQYDQHKAWFKNQSGVMTQGWNYPPNNGAVAGTAADVTLPAGARMDRFGSERGYYTAPTGSSFEGRALPPGSLAEQYRKYRVKRDITVNRSTAAPAFGQNGGATQYKLNKSVLDHMKGGDLERDESTNDE